MPSQERAPGVVMYVDGGSRGNPGPAAYAIVVKDSTGKPLARLSKFLGYATNNAAEYEALLAALEHALRYRHLRLKVLSDSELLVRQMRGNYRVKSLDLKPLYQRARQMIDRLESFSIEHIPRERNREADRLVNDELDMAEAPIPSLEPRAPSALSLRAKAVYRRGALRLQRELPLAEGEEVDLEIRRKS